MKKIYKYDLNIIDRFSILMPRHAKILSVQVQYDKPYIWALIDDDIEIKERHFLIVGTGQEIKYDTDLADYVGTFQILDGALVWHLFDLYYPDNLP